MNPAPTLDSLREIEGANWRRMVVRTITNGQVTIQGRVYVPDDRWMAYDGRLDGQRWAFGRYENHPDMVALWGTEAAYHGADDWDTRPDVIDGHFPWMWWRAR